MNQSLGQTDLSSFEGYYVGSWADDIQVGTKCANVAKCCKVQVFCRGLGASCSRKFYIFYVGKCYLRHSETMKQQITPGLEKTKGDISEYNTVYFSKPSVDLHKSRRTCTILFLAHRLAQSQKTRQCCIKKSVKHTS